MTISRDRSSAWQIWLMTRLLLFVVLLSIESESITDLNYYKANLADLSSDGVAATLAEYPIPAFVVLVVPYALLSVAGWAALYQIVVMVLLYVVDAGFFRALLDRARGPAPLIGWLAATPALGAITYARFDLLPGVLMGLALLYFVRSPGRAAVLAAAATGLKYAPVLALPALGAPSKSRWVVLKATTATGAALVVLSLVVGGWDRLFSPLSYQGERGLQIESIAATPVMLRWAITPGEHKIFYATSLSWEIDGPWTAGLLIFSTVLTALLICLLLGLWICAWRVAAEPGAALPAVVWLVLAAMSAFIVSSKVLSPQYLLWLLPAACAGLAVLEGEDSRRLRWWTTALLVTAVLTHAVYPYGYSSLLLHSGWSLLVALLLAVRNLLLAVLCATALLRAAGAIRSLSRRPRDPGVHPASAR